MGKIKQFWTDLRSSLWFVPLLLVAGLVAAAYGLIEVDARNHGDLATRWPRLFAASAEGSRAMLSAIAGSIMTVAGVVFSITVVALAQASTQYSPRVLRNFMRDRSNQVVFGMFLGIFAYCLVVLRNITSGSQGGFVPAIAVLVGFLLSLLAVLLLIYFIHHIATAIQASEMIAGIAAETLQAAARTFREDSGGRASDETPRGTELEDEQSGRMVPANATGYIQRVEFEELSRIAADHQTAITLEQRIGEFVVRGTALVKVASRVDVTPAFTRAVNRSFGIGTYRTVEQDPEFGVRQILDISLKALSPGINDTGTAITCLDYLSAIFSQLAGLRLEPAAACAGGRGRVVVKGPEFSQLLGHTFGQILENARQHQAVLLHMLTALSRISTARCTIQRQRDLLSMTKAIGAVANGLPLPSGREAVRKRADELCELIESTCAVIETEQPGHKAR